MIIDSQCSDESNPNQSTDLAQKSQKSQNLHAWNEICCRVFDVSFHQTFQVPKMEESSHISSMDTAYM